MDKLSLANFQLFHYRPFSGKLPTISEYSKEVFFFEYLCLLKSEVLNCRSVVLVKMGQFRKDFVGNFEILEHPFLSEHFQNVSVVQSVIRL